MVVNLIACTLYVTVCSASLIYNKNTYLNAHDRFILFPDDEGEIHLIDLQGDVNKTGIDEYARNPESNFYWLYTRKNPNTEQVLNISDANSVEESNFDKNKETIVIVHGWGAKGKSVMGEMLTEAFLEAAEVNVIVLDWSAIASRNYVTARYGVPAVGRALGNFLEWMKQFGASYEKMHLVGFSLGGHLVGNAGRYLDGKIRRIKALDPAGPLWNGESDRIVETDGKYVEVIHTNTGFYGFADPCGHVDFYPNGGNSMPGCWRSSCSHSRAYEYMAASVKYNHLIGNLCTDLTNVTRNECDGEFFPMGNGNIKKSGSGIYRVDTENVYPF